MGKIYTDYDEYLQDAYEEQIDKYVGLGSTPSMRGE